MVCLLINLFYIKIAAGVDKRFTVKAKAELVFLVIVVVNGVDKVGEFNKVDKHREIALL